MMSSLGLFFQAGIVTARYHIGVHSDSLIQWPLDISQIATIRSLQTPSSLLGRRKVHATLSP
jgi:hypothetical protein